MNTSTKMKILYFEDEPNTLEMVSFYLTHCGYDVITARDGRHGLVQARQQLPNLILADIYMPIMTGFEMLEELRKDRQLAAIPLVFLSAAGANELVSKGLSLGAVDYITKPFNQDDLRLRIEIVLNRINRQKPSYGFAEYDISHRVFVSYSRKDHFAMRQLKSYLGEQKLNVWVDDENIEPGSSAWERAISGAIRDSGCLVVLLSPDAEQSIWVGRELAMAETLNKKIFPVMVRGSEKDAIPFRLITHQWVDARENYDDALQILVASIRKHLGIA